MRKYPDADQLCAWTVRRQLLDGTADGPIDVLRRCVAVYSSHPTAPLSLLARCRTLSTEDYLRLDAERAAVRLPAMRGSVFLMPVETAPMILSATCTPIEKLSGRLEYGDFSWADYEAIKPRVLEAAVEPLSAKELHEAIPVEGKLMVAVRVMSYEGLMLRVGTSPRSDSWKYVATEAWLGRPFELDDPNRALSWLADTYLRGFGPARVEDFAWWAGLSKRQASTSFDSLDLTDVGGGWMLPADLLRGWERTMPNDPEHVVLLPKWDALTMAYTSDGRDRFIQLEHQAIAYAKKSATSGDGRPLVLRGGQAVAVWEHRFQHKRMQVSLTPFNSGTSLGWLDESRFQPIADFLGADSVSLTIVDR
jgi:hypothetical protein